jgi:2-phosphoglycerate kinase
MIFLLGGPPRVGKSIISSEIRQKHAVSVVSTDTLGAVLENVLSPEAAPDLFAFEKGKSCCLESGRGFYQERE